MKGLMKNSFALFAIAVSVMLLAACSSGGTQTITKGQASGTAAQAGGSAPAGGAGAASGGGAVEQEESASSKLSLDKIYRFDSVKSYEYKITTAGQSMNLKYDVSSDSVNGVSAWLQKSEMTAQGSSVITKMWLEKATLKCLKLTSQVSAAGQSMPEQETQCPTSGDNSATNTEVPEVGYAGKESVTVPAGTFSADKYTSREVTYWVSGSVPVPVKYAAGNTMMELVSYS